MAESKSAEGNGSGAGTSHGAASGRGREGPGPASADLAPTSSRAPRVPLGRADPAAAGLDVERLDDLAKLIERHLAEGRYPGCQIAIARHGKLLVDRSFGDARLAPAAVPAGDETLWLLYSNTKILIATALWRLADQGAFGFSDRMSDHVSEFSRHGKRDITILQLITHQGGFPNAVVPAAVWHDSDLLRRTVSDFTLEWTPGTRVQYHALSAHWVLAVLIERLTGRDFRSHVTEAVLEPAGLDRELFMSLPPSEDRRVSDMHVASEGGPQWLEDSNNETWRRGGAPGGGAYGTARGMAALYQMMLAGGEFNGRRLVSPRMLGYAIRNHTGERPDLFMGMPMHRGLGPHLRGTSENIRGLGAMASPRVFGHGGVGSSYCWGDPDSGVSFAYLTNLRAGEPWHTERLDRICNLVHSAILPAASD